MGRRWATVLASKPAALILRERERVLELAQGLGPERVFQQPERGRPGRWVLVLDRALELGLAWRPASVRASAGLKAWGYRRGQLPAEPLR